MIIKSVEQLINYGVDCGLVEFDDRIYLRNRLFSLLKIENVSICNEAFVDEPLEKILSDILIYAIEKEIIDDNSIERDLFDTEIMGILTQRPSDVNKKFYSLYSQSPVEATDYFYKFSQDNNYIRRYRIAKDVKWVSKTDFGDLDITINLSKPEKDPRAIAAEKNAKQSGYPKCLLCAENVGYSGRINHPARQNHRFIPIKIDGEDWGLQYSPYVYYNEHCIVFNTEHKPMKIDNTVFRKLLDFVKLFPHYFIGSNADLPIVGGSILSHEHFQGGNYKFAMEKAPILEEIENDKFSNVNMGIVKWPMSVIRLSSSDTDKLVEAASHILKKWREYTDESAFIFAYTDDTPHNTITPIARFNEDKFELDLVLRNNITTDEHPFGVYHPHTNLHHIKKENIGLIEVMGLAVLPSRLKEELSLLEDYLILKKDISSNEIIEKHSAWAETFTKNYTTINRDNVHEIVENEVGKVFREVLCDAGVFKQDEVGLAAFKRFISSI